jgi:hypothetical protein
MNHKSFLIDMIDVFRNTRVSYGEELLYMDILLFQMLGYDLLVSPDTWNRCKEKYY